jgi:hypothetical protein
MRTSLVIPGAITVATLLGLAISRKKIRFIGDRAEKGDEIVVPSQAAAALAGLAGLVPLLQQTTTAIGLTVTSTGADEVHAVPAALYAGATRVPIPGQGDFVVPRSAISAVYRDGRQVALS